MIFTKIHRTFVYHNTSRQNFDGRIKTIVVGSCSCGHFSYYNEMSFYHLLKKIYYAKLVFNFCFHLCIFYEVELFGSMSNFGISLGFPAGLICERFGSRIASLCGMVIATSGFVLLWTTAFSIEFYTARPALQDLYYFVAGTCYLILV